MKGIPEVFIDGALYVGIAVLTVFLAEGRGITKEKLDNWTWLDSTLLGASMLVAGAIALKTYRSESVARHRREIRIEEAKESGGGTTTTEVSTKQVDTETVDTKTSETKPPIKSMARPESF